MSVLTTLLYMIEDALLFHESLDQSHTMSKQLQCKSDVYWKFSLIPGVARLLSGQLVATAAVLQSSHSWNTAKLFRLDMSSSPPFLSSASGIAIERPCMPHHVILSLEWSTFSPCCWDWWSNCLPYVATSGLGAGIANVAFALFFGWFASCFSILLRCFEGLQWALWDTCIRNGFPKFAMTTAATLPRCLTFCLLLWIAPCTWTCSDKRCFKFWDCGGPVETNRANENLGNQLMVPCIGNWHQLIW